MAKEQIVKDKNIIKVPIKNPIKLDGVLLDTVILNFTKMSGADVLKVDEELRIEGKPSGFDSLFNHHALLKLASKASGILPDDLIKLHAADYMEVSFVTRNFFIQW